VISSTHDEHEHDGKVDLDIVSSEDKKSALEYIEYDV
jgi:hypothetical protein